MKKSNWTEIIYDVYDFLYWEPQHIGKIKNKNSKINNVDKAISHVKNMEVSLNQILNFFFSFLPNKLFIELINSCLVENIKSEKFTLYLKEVDNLIEGINFSTQPDFFFIGENSNIFIEMKLNSKSSLEQLMKYVYLHIKDCERIGYKKEMIFVFLGKGNFQNLFKERYKNVSDLKTAFESYEINNKMKKGNIDLVDYKKEIKNIVKNLNIGFLNYGELKNFCIKNIEKNNDNELLIKLLSGLVNEIDLRNLK